jgi:hypothetical protein
VRGRILKVLAAIGHHIRTVLRFLIHVNRAGAREHLALPGASHGQGHDWQLSDCSERYPAGRRE